MVSTFTPNIQLEEPARGDDVGTWDTPVNSNMTLLDLVVGGATGISAAAGSVVLAAAQFQCNRITFNSTLLASITITFPTSFQKTYDIYNTATGSSAFTITLQTTAAGGEKICCPPGELTEVFNNGQSLRFKSLDRIGGYWDYAGSSVPNWVSGCTIPPYLNCDGTTFSSATYPTLATILGSTTLPDTRGRARAALNQTTGRMLSSNGGVDGNTAYSAGGGDTQTLTLAQIPTGIIGNGFPAGDNTRFFPTLTGANWGTQLFNLATNISVPFINAGAFNQTNTVTFTSCNTGGGAHGNMQPTYVGGITMIRAA